MTEKADNEAVQERVLEVFPRAVHSEVFPRLHRISCTDNGPRLFGKTEAAAWRSAAKWIEKNLYVDELNRTNAICKNSSSRRLKRAIDMRNRKQNSQNREDEL